MCIFSAPVVSVNGTRIFSRLSGAGTQFLAYQMNYESVQRNAMILPIPVARPAAESQLRFISLESYENFFDDLDQGFPHLSGFSLGCGGLADKSVASRLKVFKVGSYIASFVPALSDFARLSPEFNLADETWAKVPEYSEFGFAVFQLAAGAMKPHPMAFEFETDRSDLYFPTLHIHDGEVHDVEQFDHAIYMQHAGFDSRVYGYQNSNVADRSTGLVRSVDRAKRFCDVERAAGLVDGELLVHRRLIRGKLPNEDTIIEAWGDALKTSFNIRPWLHYTPWLLALAGVAWFFQRRSKLKHSREGESS